MDSLCKSKSTSISEQLENFDFWGRDSRIIVRSPFRAKHLVVVRFRQPAMGQMCLSPVTPCPHVPHPHVPLPPCPPLPSCPPVYNIDTRQHQLQATYPQVLRGYVVSCFFFVLRENMFLGTSHCSCLEHCFLFCLHRETWRRETCLSPVEGGPSQIPRR